MVTSKLGKEFIVVPGASRHLGNNTVLGSHNVNLQAAPEDIKNEDQPAPGHTSAWGRQTMLHTEKLTLERKI